MALPGGCYGPPAPPADRPSAPLPAPEAVPPAGPELRALELTVVRPDAGVASTTPATLALAVEWELLSSAGVAAVVVGRPVSPGLDPWLPGSPKSVATLTWAEGGPSGRGLVVLKLCDPAGKCGQAELSAATPAAAAARQLVRGVVGDGEVLSALRAPSDAYATTVLERAAATWLGWRAHPAEALIGRPKHDPRVRAVYLAPDSVLGWWVRGRSELERGAGKLGLDSFARLATLAPLSVTALAAYAGALAGEGQAARAAEQYRGLAQLSPGDPRLELAVARARLLAGDPQGAARAVARRAGRGDPAALAVLADAADAGAADVDGDAVLARWADAAPDDPAPVRRRLRTALDARRYEQASALVIELSRRGVPAPMKELGPALALAAGDPVRAAAVAAKAGHPRFAARLRALEKLRTAPKRIPEEIDKHWDPVAAITRGEVWLAAGRHKLALAEAKSVLELRPYSPEGLALRASALEASGRAGEAVSVRAALRRADPAWSGNTAPFRAPP